MDLIKDNKLDFDLGQLTTQLITDQLSMVEKNDLPKRLIEKTLDSFMKDSQTLEDLKLSIDLESNLKTFSINSVAKHLDYLSVFKLIID